jgi:hypothetical protein
VVAVVAVFIQVEPLALVAQGIHPVVVEQLQVRTVGRRLQTQAAAGAVVE